MIRDAQGAIDAMQAGVLPDMAEVESVERQRYPRAPESAGGMRSSVGGALPMERIAHPVALLFPMMTDEELDGLAEDIRANGQAQPILLDADDRIVDGRNRAEACRRAGIEPRFEALNGQDPVSLILSLNISRRHLRKAQQGILIMRSMADSASSTATISQQYGIARRYLDDCDRLVKDAPDLADAVLFTGKPFATALAELDERDEANKTEEQRLAALRAGYPDLAISVEEQETTLKEALEEAARRTAAAAAQEAAERERRALLTRRFDNMLTALDPEDRDKGEWARSLLATDASLIERDADLSPERAERAAATLIEYARLRRQENHG